MIEELSRRVGERMQRAWRLADAYAVMTVEQGLRREDLGRRAYDVRSLTADHLSPEEQAMNRDLLQHALDRRLVGKDPHHRQVLHVLRHYF